MPYKYGVELKGESKLNFSAGVFAKKEEADLAGRELLSRWFAPIGYKVVQTEDEVNYEIIDNLVCPISRNVDLNLMP